METIKVPNLIITLPIKGEPKDYAELVHETSLRLEKIKEKYPIIQDLLDEQLTTHTSEAYPYHSCTNEVDQDGVPTDHINYVMFHSVLFAIASGLSDKEIVAAAIAGAGHDYFQGPDHEIRSADHIVKLMQEKHGIADDKLINLVHDAIKPTKITFIEGKLIQDAPTSKVGSCLASADLETSGGHTWDKFIEDSMRMRKESFRANTELNKPNLNDNDTVAVKFMRNQIMALFNIFSNHRPYRTKASEHYFGHLEENTHKLAKKLELIDKLYEANPEQEKTFAEWREFMLT